MDNMNITSGNFDYDVYSGENAKEFLRQENERKQQERERASKSAAELKREEYEKRFAGMSADDIFGMPSPKKKKRPEEDFSDFFNSDAAAKQAEKAKAAKEQSESASRQQDGPRLENMMPGEDTPSSSQAVDQRLLYARAMIDRKLEQEAAKAEEDRHYRAVSGHRKSREIRYRAYDAAEDMIGGSLGIEDFHEKVTSFFAYYGGLVVGTGIMGLLNRYFFKIKDLALVFIAAAVMGFIFAVVNRRISKASSMSEAIKLSWKEALFSIAAIIIGVILELFVLR